MTLSHHSEAILRKENMFPVQGVPRMMASWAGENSFFLDRLFVSV